MNRKASSGEQSRRGTPATRTSTGALGLRKFPNPRFDAEKWRKLNGSLGSWDAYGKFLSGDQGDGDSRTNRLFDG